MNCDICKKKLKEEFSFNKANIIIGHYECLKNNNYKDIKTSKWIFPDSTKYLKPIDFEI